MQEVREQVPARTTPTWEMELLVSGITILGLLQLPGLIDGIYFRAMNISPEAYARLLSPLWVYTKVAVVILLLTFITHLWMRGYWVALVGLNSVYPGGIRWDRLGLGPLTREHFEQGPQESMDDVIERADNRATRVFGVGFSFAAVMLGLVAFATIAIAGAVLVAVVAGERYATLAFGAIAAALMLPWLLASVLDYSFNKQLRRSPRLAAAVMKVSAAYARGMGFGPRSLMSLFASHAGVLRFSVMTILILVPVLLMIEGQALLARGRLPFAYMTGLPATDPFSASSSLSDFYADQRDGAPTVSPMPRIASRVATGPYVELFVPYIPRLHEATRPVPCPPTADTAIGSRKRLDCLARLLALQLDGKPLLLRFDASTDPVSDQPGMLAMVPVKSLPAGRHELSFNAPGRPVRPGGPPRRYRIPFWK